ncbi:UvrD-helicase domain-containing protein [Paenibacillus sp.]|uniref:UvrD-helicase domain-containing protein n=1 Tax=Paenibacillus sp. TaxID=58172 RepID=UPI002D2DE71E|nr:UvrD-helicase domain-containing protein [Paenibacillus sp.]HZG57009.1 UvrD-helicase domain-containing protein [Paenibacillus sp.]
MFNTEAAMLEDEAARRRIEADLDTSFLVEAGAGSGKTTSLVGRMLALVEAGKAEVRSMAAITFTNKAAAELRGRFRLRLESRLREAADEAVKERLSAALRQLPEGFVGTIHAFCGRLLRERPIDAGLDPDFREADEAESRERLEAYWDDYLLELRERDAGAIDRLAELGVHVEDMRAVYLCAAMYEDVRVYTEAAPRPDFGPLRASLLPLLEEAARALPSHRPDAGWDALQQAVRNASAFLRSRDVGEDLALLALAATFDRSLTPTLKRWPDPAAAKALKERFAALRLEVLQPFFRSWREYLHPHVVRFVLPAVAYAKERRLREGALSFQDLLMKATELLRERPEARRYFSSRYTRLFVDEFQDTDPIQAEMMLLLTGGDPGERDWRKQRPKPGSLFIVGDPKQSIYRFRRADISTYNFVKRILAANGDVLRLTRNFRSARAIGDFVNYAFEAKFLPPGRSSDAQADFVPMLPARPNPAGKGLWHGVYTLTASKAEYDRKADIAAEDADRIARWIAWACDGRVSVAERQGGKETTRPARPDDFLILVKYREFLGLYAERLEAYGVPAETSGSLARYDELAALRTLAACLADPYDRLPLLAVLRGPLFGVSDAALYAYTTAVRRLSLLGAEPEGVSVPDAARPVVEALGRLREFWGWTRKEPALSAFLRIAERLGVLPYAAVQPSGAVRSGTLAKLFETIGAEADAASDWSVLSRRLAELSEANGLEGASLFAGAGRAVRIMNLHKAKGLEAPIVFLACPCGDSDRDATEHIDRLREPATGYFAIARRKDFQTEIVAQPLGWDALVEKEREYMLAERDRLLYVAATRAKQLTIVSRYPYKPAIDPWSGLGAALEGQPELDDVRRGESPRERWNGPFDAEASLRAWRDAQERAARATYDVASVTSLAKGAAAELPPRSAEGRGAAFGTAVHRALEAAGSGARRDALDAVVRAALAEEGADPALADDALAMVDAVLNGETWERAMRAKRRCHEFTFAASSREEGFERVVNGVIDLVFEEEDGWVIVDFKTDAMSAAQEPAYLERYAPQVAAYAEFWRRMSGEHVKETGLWFLHTRRYVRTDGGEAAPAAHGGTA